VHAGEEETLLGWYRNRLTLRRQLPPASAQLNLTERTLVLERECFPLQPREMQLLLLLAAASSACSFEHLCAELWGHDDESKRRQLRQYVYQLRQKLGRHGGLIQYVRGVGYRCFLVLDVVRVD
jgi:DNA-binding response OmpR family regulator